MFIDGHVFKLENKNGKKMSTNNNKSMIDRREFLKTAAGTVAGAAIGMGMSTTK